MNRLLATTAVVLLLGAAPALAEDQAPTDNSAGPSAMQAPNPVEPPAMQSPADPGAPLPGKSSEAPKPSPNADLSEAPKPTPNADLADKGSKGSGAQFLSKQSPTDWLASTIIDKPVVNAANETIGDVNDLVTDNKGRIVAVLIGAGGFLGIGEKDVAIPYESLKLARDENDNVTVIADLTKDQLASAPDYQTLDEQEVTQSSAKTDLDEKTKTY
jgi:sporulation protein YlmC with PRC-barrel domain